MKWVLRIGIGLVVLVLIAVGVGYIMLRQAGKEGSGTIERWVGAQLTSVTDSYLNPRVSFTDLDYEYPGTVRLKGLRFSADDPANPGKPIDIIGAAGATIVLAEIPSIGKPVIIESISLDQPLVQVVATGPGSDDFVGFSNFVKQKTESSDEKLSDIFRMRLVELKGAKVVYDPRIAGTQPMLLDDINTRMDVEPTADGWYKLATRIVRAPVFDLNVIGQLSLDTFHIRGLALVLKGRVGREYDRYLPPEVQQILIEHEVRGTVDLTVVGDMSIEEPVGPDSKLTAKVRLTGANVSVSKYHVPVDDLLLTTSLANGVLSVPEFRLSNVRLTADDPVNPGKTITVFGTDSIQVAVGAVPTNGGPVVVDNVIIDHPVVQAVALEPGSMKFAGFSDLFATAEATAPATQASGQPVQPSPTATATAPDKTAPETKLSDVIQLRMVELREAKIVYDPRIAGTQAMELDGINTRLDIQPGAAGGWYTLGTKIDKAPLFGLSVAGDINIDTLDVRGLDVRLKGSLGREFDKYLPPQVQQPLVQYEVRGALDVSVAGELSPRDLMGPASKLTAKLNLANANVGVAGYHTPIDDLSISATLAGGTISVPEFKLKNFQLAADDPLNAGQRIVVLGTESITVVVGAIPLSGGPVVIDNVTLEKPLVQAIALGPGSSKFAGFSELIDAGDGSARPTTAASTVVPKISEIVRMKKVELREAKVVYDPRIAGTQPMRLDGINTSLDIEHGEVGWYKLATRIARAPLFDLSVAGQVSVDTLDVRGLDVSLHAQVERGHDGFLPPQLQQMLIEHEVRGTFDLTIRGDVDAASPIDSNLVSTVHLRDANLSLAEYQIPVTDLLFTGTLANRRAGIPQLTLQALQGDAHLSASLDLGSDDLTISSTLEVTDMVLQDTLRKGADTGAEPKYGGRVNAEVTLDDVSLLGLIENALPPPSASTMPATATTTQPTAPNVSEVAGPGSDVTTAPVMAGIYVRELPPQWGSGRVTIDRATLANSVAFLRKLSDLVGKIKRSPRGSNEQLELDFEFTGDHVTFNRFYYKSDIALSHGRGTLSLQQWLDMTIDAGGFLGSFVDKLVAYKVTGRLADPDFNLKFGSDDLTAGAHKVGGAIDKGAKATGRGLKKAGDAVGGFFKKITKKREQ